jgi:hypothetical protein
VSLALASPVLVALVPVSPIPAVPAAPLPPSLVLHALSSAAETALFRLSPILKILILQFVKASVAGPGRDQDHYLCRDPPIYRKRPSI